MRSSQAKGPQQENVVKKNLLQLCISIPQLLGLKHPCRIISLGVRHPIMRLVQNILSLPKYCQKKGGGVICEIYKIFPSCTSQISLQCTLNGEMHKLLHYSYVKACYQDVYYVGHFKSSAHCACLASRMMQSF